MHEPEWSSQPTEVPHPRPQAAPVADPDGAPSPDTPEAESTSSAFPGTGSNEESLASSEPVPAEEPSHPVRRPRFRKPAWKLPRPRLGLKRPRFASRLTFGWQTRFKVAIVLSFVALVSVLIADRLNQAKTKHQPPRLAINSGPNPKSDKAADKSKPDEKAPPKPSPEKPQVASTDPAPGSQPPRPLDPSVLNEPAPTAPAVEPIRQTAALSIPPAPPDTEKETAETETAPVEPSTVPPQPPDMPGPALASDSDSPASQPPALPDELAQSEPPTTPALSEPPAPPDSPTAPAGPLTTDLSASSPPNSPTTPVEPLTTDLSASAPPSILAGSAPSAEESKPGPMDDAVPPTILAGPDPEPTAPASASLAIPPAGPGAPAPGLGLAPASPQPEDTTPVLAAEGPASPLDLGTSGSETSPPPVSPVETGPLSTPAAAPQVVDLAPQPSSGPVMPSTPEAPQENPAPLFAENPPPPDTGLPSGASMATATAPDTLQLEPPPSTNSLPPSPAQPNPQPSPATGELAAAPDSGSDPTPVGGRIDPITHVVRRGETFYSIARYYYGSGRYYRALWMANRDQVPDLSKPLWVGSAIMVPAPEDLDRSGIDPPRPLTGSLPASSIDPQSQSSSRMDDQTERAGRFLQVPPGESPLALPRSAGASADTSETPPASHENVPEIHRSGPRVHVVSSPYETLRSIARQELGDPDRERELLDLNSDQIDNPNLLPQGVKVRLPEH